MREDIGRARTLGARTRTSGAQGHWAHKDTGHARTSGAQESRAHKNIMEEALLGDLRVGLSNALDFRTRWTFGRAGLSNALKCYVAGQTTGAHTPCLAVLTHPAVKFCQTVKVAPALTHKASLPRGKTSLRGGRRRSFEGASSRESIYCERSLRRR
ncbi:hypothetical protein BD626DRAFT_280691 [Schizophyllum amplum]|uniref:Uncharacterized protein n=1 Tax=Schizophyllum amplum TaxID=97359 RepID=A0A550BT80_9AGAR|nr:hypothetical protein BD626DRAFT_280691 [Auriculariopsis ampla]